MSFKRSDLEKFKSYLKKQTFFCKTDNNPSKGNFFIVQILQNVKKEDGTTKSKEIKYFED